MRKFLGKKLFLTWWEGSYLNRKVYFSDDSQFN